MNKFIKIFITLLLLFLSEYLNIYAKTLEVGSNKMFNDLKSALLNSTDGDTIIIYGGSYSGNFEIKKSLTIIGKSKPVIDGESKGTVITVDAQEVTLTGLTIQNSGKLLDKEDAGILVNADNAFIDNNVLKSVLFGIYFKKANGGVITNNFIEGKKDLDIPRRGDLFRAWYSKNLLIEKNQFRYGRDVIIWFSENSTIRNNNMSDARYGLHFMYSNDCKIDQNIMNDNSVGIYLMYSKNLRVRNNLITNNIGATGFGIGLKDLDNVELTNNVIADNRVGIFVDNSPRNADTFMKYFQNLIAYNETGVEVISSLENSQFNRNSFLENYEQTSLSRGQNSNNEFWKQNYWSDYSGYDKNNDGVGDIPYKSEQILENLIEDKPNLKFFLYSPAINTINYASDAFPIFTPETKLIDEEPLLKSIMPLHVPVLKVRRSSGLFLFSLILTMISAFVLILFRYRNQLVHNIKKDS
jgi:nitrous oxidase accessory protein